MNDAAAFFAYLLVGLLIVAFIAVVHFLKAHELSKVYRQLAAKYGGSSHRTSIFAQPTARFVYQNANALVDTQLASGPQHRYFTRLQVSWPDRTLRLEVYPASLVHRLGKLIGMGDVRIGSPKFDAGYIISGNEVAEIKSFLNVHVQAAIERLRRFTGQKDVHVSVIGGRLIIKKLGVIRDGKTLSRFVELALDIYEAAIQASAEGIDFVERPAGASITPEEVVCQICGEDITLDAVHCISCKTPHHKDCWEYYGACSTYGCGQKRHTGPR